MTEDPNLVWDESRRDWVGQKGEKKKSSFVNEWKFSGEVFKINELEKDFGASVYLRGCKKDSFASHVVEFTCLLTKEAWNESKSRLKRQCRAELSGQLDKFINENNGKERIMLIAEKAEII